MWKLIQLLLPALLKLLGLGGDKSDAQEGLDKGERLGQAETKAAQDDRIIKDVADANAARDSVPDGSVRDHDPFERK